MKLIEISADKNGFHNNIETKRTMKTPDGWAEIPDEMEMPDTFPYVNIEVKNGIVTKMTAGVVPEIATKEPVNEIEQLRAEVEQLRAELAEIKGAE